LIAARLEEAWFDALARAFCQPLAVVRRDEARAKRDVLDEVNACRT
jgi:hypothetical protein